MKRQLLNGKRGRLQRSARSREKMRRRRIGIARPDAPFLTPAQMKHEAERRAPIYQPAPPSRDQRGSTARALAGFLSIFRGLIGRRS